MGNEENTIRPGQNGAGQSLERIGFGTTEIVQQRETQGMALAARAQAEVQARYIMAMQRQRNLEQVRIRLLAHCKRPGFALIAEYAKPVGNQKVRGPSIRFVETALQEYGNVLPDATIVYDDDYKRVIRVSVTDLERNVTYNDDAIVEKFVERKKPKDSDEILGARTNSFGEQVYRIRATEDDFGNKAAAAVSKKTRNLGLRILPADIVAESMDVCRVTRETKDAQDPAAARRWVLDRFAELRIMPLDVDAYLGHPFDQASPAEVDELRAIYATVREGEAKWPDILEMQKAQRGEIEKPSKAAEATSDKIRAKIADVRAKQAQKTASPPKTEPAKTDAPKSEPAVAQAKPATDNPKVEPVSSTELTEADKRAIEAAEREEMGK